MRRKGENEMDLFARRRFLIAAGSLLAAPRLARAQAQEKLPVLGILTPFPRPKPEEIARSRNPLIVRLRELGWVEGKTLLIERAYGEGREGRLPELAATLVAKKVDVIWAFSSEGAVAAARATSTIPIVFWGVPAPVEQGLVESFARPGRNVTGVAFMADLGVEAKRLELLREIAPSARRLAAISVPTGILTVAGGSVDLPSATDAAASKLGFELRRFPIEKQEDFEPVFAAILAWGAEVLTVSASGLFGRNRARIAEFANRNRLPSAFTLPDYSEAGGLVSYGIEWQSTFAQTADYIDRILRGAKPGELPVDLPRKYMTVVNLRTARALGLKVPQSVLLRADRVIE
jgi:putative ABC transport system substrate-binding protein